MAMQLTSVAITLKVQASVLSSLPPHHVVFDGGAERTVAGVGWLTAYLDMIAERDDTVDIDYTVGSDNVFQFGHAEDEEAAVHPAIATVKVPFPTPWGWRKIVVDLVEGDMHCLFASDDQKTLKMFSVPHLDTIYFSEDGTLNPDKVHKHVQLHFFHQQ